MKDLTVLVTGSGMSSLTNIEELLTDWIFKGNDSRNVKVVIPFTDTVGKGLNNFLIWGQDFFQWGDTEGDPLIGIVMPNGGHKLISKATETKQVITEELAIGKSLSVLTSDREDGNEIAVISLFDPASEFDLALISDAKDLAIPTFNLCEGLVDSFEGYQSAESIMLEGAAREKFLKEEAEKDAIAQVAKPVAKKAPAPRKRAAKKAVASQPAAALQDAEKPLQDVSLDSSHGTVTVTLPKHVHTFIWADDENGHEGSVCTGCGEMEEDSPSLSGLDKLIAKAVERDHAKRGIKNTPLEGLSVFASSENISDVVPDAWADPTGGKILVSRKDLADLAQGINLITGAFTRIMQGDK